MARPLRLSFENAVYHITARGNRRENIFYSDRDRNVFLDKINETFEKYSFICYAYCLMDNHYHLFLKTPFANLPEGMHYLNASYANWFRTRYKLVGTVFQGRYKSILVDEDSYALVLSAYIHLNPLRAGVVRHLEKYQWSSFLDYIGTREAVIERLDVSFILNQFGNNLAQAQERYKGFVMDNMKMENPLKDAFKGIAVGTEAFIEKVKEKMKSIGKNREIRETKFLEAHSAEGIIRELSRCFGIEKQDIFSKKRGNIYRQMALYLIKRHTPLSLKEIGNLFNMDYTAVSYAAKRFEERFKEDKRVLGMLNKITQSLN
ncbi:MAG: transposase [Candidatus Desulfofervidus sp.]|nr:transposase [Candidatus Desulfofervidus sp.]